ncbi:MAG TPA: hypothetical protein VMH05_16690 [Bryobacteraceae bacterium]|nr:hypothetical protein [Bryobacteraceae bacterium]
MFGRIWTLPLAVVACFSANAASAWKLTTADHFEVYSQASPERTVALLEWFEQLRACLLNQTIIPLDGLPSVRLIVFASPKEYEPYRVRTLSDGYYAASEGRRYIAMVAGTGQRRVAAHEFAHLVFDASGAKLPSWLGEGLAELFSTIHINAKVAELGAAPLEQLATLRQHPWIPLSRVLSVERNDPIWDDLSSASLFYTESWALADMLVFSREYAPRFQALWAAIRTGSPAPKAFKNTFDKSITDVETDLHAWIGSYSDKSLLLAGESAPVLRPDASPVPDFTARSVLADMLAAAGELDRAEELLRNLALEAPDTAEISVALGSIALRKGDQDGARREWKRAMNQGVTDADVFYRFALLADQAQLPAVEIRSALERAVALRPDFDDARYRLALLEKNAGHYDAALAQLRAMRTVPAARAFSYWIAMADALNELGRRDESATAARKAAQHASTQLEKARAAQLAYFAQTDVTVQIAPGENGQTQMVTARVPHHSAEDWNPFVEVGDDVRTVRGILREVDCDVVTEIRVDSGGALLTLAIPDPSRVQMRNAPEEFVCGPQEKVLVKVQYAASKNGPADGLVRGIEFLR